MAQYGGGSHTNGPRRVGNFRNQSYMSIPDASNIIASPGVLDCGNNPYIITPIAANAAGVAADQTLDNADAVLVSPIVELDVARNVTITGVVGTTAVDFQIYGYDEYGIEVGETITGPAGATTVSTSKTFKAITRCFTAGDTTADISIGFGDVFGLPLRANYFDTLINCYWNEVAITSADFTAADGTSPATATTGDVRGTIAVPSAADGNKRLVVYQFVNEAIVLTENQTDEGYLGVPQFSF